MSLNVKPCDQVNREHSWRWLRSVAYYGRKDVFYCTRCLTKYRED
jgi:hypothetical protein